MSIVKAVSEETPSEGQVVYCDNPPFASDRAVFKSGKFIGGGEFPTPSYEMKNTTKWFCMNQYQQYFIKSGAGAFNVSFSQAENI